jgi:manganese transport protein|uniref:Divalent metal cation transporter MntH n=1 Tax=Thiomonas intermedia (strain K12) TaxID=75379 RepID=D5X055_THIK1
MNAACASLDERTRRAALAVLGSRRARRRDVLSFVGPALIAAVAYIDPGNFATNLQSGSQFGYSLLWVVLWSNVAAMFIQTLSAKLGIATGMNLPEVIAAHWPRPLVWLYWIQAELVAIFTDLAEFLGAALGLALLTGLPQSASALIAAGIVFALLSLERHGFRPVELMIGALLGIVALSYGLQLLLSPVHWPVFFRSALAPTHLPDADTLYFAAGILGATVMPHVIYLHSSLTQRRVVVAEADKPRLMALTRREIVFALSLAGLVNMAMLAVAAATFSTQVGAAPADLTSAWKALTPLLGASAATLFAVALLASGISSSVVGTMAGQVVMQGFMRFTIPLWLRRSLTLLPAVAVIAQGWNLTHVLVLSQVVLSFGIPFALAPLMLFTSRAGIMGSLVNSRWVKRVGWSLTGAILLVNLWLLMRLL